MMMAAFSGGDKVKLGRLIMLGAVILACVIRPCFSRPRMSEVEDFHEDDDGIEVEENKRDDELLEAALEYLPKNGELFEGDMIMDERLKRAVYGEKAKKTVRKKKSIMWPGGVVPYEIDPLFPKFERDLLKEAHKEFHNRTCIRFKKRDPLVDKNYLYYTNVTDTCSSYVGMQGGKQIIHLGKDCAILGTFEHENMHALGFIHEHSRPDRDDYVKVIVKNIKKEDLPNFQKYTMEMVDSYQPLNFASIMMYRNDAFTKNGEDTIKSLEEPDLQFGQRFKFSCGDVYAINKLYDCREQLENLNCHHLYAAYHTKSRKKKRKDLQMSAWERNDKRHGKGEQ